MNHVFDGILAGLTTLLGQDATIVAGGVAVSRRKRGMKWDTDALPCLFVQGGRSGQAGAATGGVVTRRYQVFGVLVYAGNYKFRTAQGDVPNMAEAVRRAMLVSRIVGTPVWRSDAGDAAEYDRDGLDAAYECAPIEVTYTTTESRQ